MSVGGIFGGHFGSVENQGIPGGPAGFVSQIVAGTNITVNPAGGTGVVTVNAAPAALLLETGMTNSTASIIPSNSVVHLTGDQTFGIARANSAVNANGVVGILDGNAAPGDGGNGVVISGETIALLEAGPVVVAGDQLWLSAVTAGAVTNVRPAANAWHIGVAKAVAPGVALVDVNIYPDDQTIAATWNITRPRIYAVDGVNGNDAFAGFADPASSSSADYAIACAAAGLVAKKTIAGLAAIFPRLGAGRLVEVVIAAGTYVDGLEVLLDGVTGYAFGSPEIRGTVTNATAGAVAFAGTTADVTMAGGVTVTGLNAAGYNPTGAPTTSVIQCLKVGGAAPAFGAEPAVPMGFRIRFDSATATVALRNQCRSVSLVSGTDTLALQTVLPAVPVAGDVFYLEQPGVVVPAFTTPSILGAPPNTSLGIQFVGIRWTGNSAFADIRARFTFCGASNLFANGTQGGGTVITVAQTYTHPVIGFLTIGGGLRNENAAGGVSAFSNLQAVFAGLVCVGPITFGGIAGMTNIQWGAGCAARNMIVANCALGSTEGTVATTTATAPNLGTTATVGIPRLFGNGSVVPLLIDGCALRLGTMVIVNAGAVPCIKFAGINKVIFSGIVSGTTGNTDVGMDLQNAVLSTIEFRASLLPTVVGSAGEIRMSSQALALYSNTTFEELYDQAGNRIFQGNVNGAAYRATMNPSVYAGVVNNGAQIPGYRLVAIQAASGQVRVATADTLPNAIGLVGAMLATAANGAQCLYGGAGGYKVVEFDGAGAVTPGAVAYLSDSLAPAGTATCTVPVVSLVKAKLRLGVVVDNTLPFNLAIVRMTPDNYPTLADGLP